MDIPTHYGLRETMRTALGQSRVLGNVAHTLRARLTKIVENPNTLFPKSHVGPVLQRVAELSPEFSSSKYMTDTELSRLRPLPLPPKRYPLEVICRAYKWRWQVELLFKEWKSYANLHAFDTAKVAIVEGLIWTAIAAAALKRFLAHMTQLLLEVPMSTRKVAMCAMHVLGDIGRALQSGDVAGLYAALEAAVTYLACHAQRAHPARDRQTGRAQLGLAPLLGSEYVIEFAAAA
jgi:hypothetical protein